MVRHGVAPYLECSSAGDIRFSAFGANVFGKSIEAHYQGAKVFADGATGLTWRQAKGRRATNQTECAELYVQLWEFYMSNNPHLYKVLAEATGLCDRFGKEGHQCQATVLWGIRQRYLEDSL